MNKLLYQDAYKATHHLQLPQKTEYIRSYGESRGGDFNFTLFHGMQAFVIEYLSGQFVTQEDINEAEIFYKKVFGYDYFNRAGWEHILNTHGGKLPIKIKAVKEGSIVPTKNVLFTIENTDPEVPWLTQFIETMLLRAIWYPTTVATISKTFKNTLQEYTEKTGCEVSPFHLNDFGARGVSSHESAGIGGCAHLINFMGTDTVEGIVHAMKYYGTDVCGHSVFATEHSTTTIYTKDGELNAYNHFLSVVPDDAIGSIVIDSYDPENAVKNLLGGKLKEKILSRKGKTVFRPDSGDVRFVPSQVCQWLWDIFGGTVNEKGFKVLNPAVSVIQGDGVSLEVLPEVLENLTNAGFATSNVIFGMGGKLLQGCNRDTLQWAIKASYGVIDGKEVDIFKDPTSDVGKKSKTGKLKLIKEKSLDGSYEYKTINHHHPLYYDSKDEMELVFECGEVKRIQSLQEIRKISNE